MKARIGVDVGGTKIEIIAIGDGGRQLHRRRIDAPRGSYERTIEAIAGLVAEAERAIGVTASIGIGIPGSISPATGLVKNANSTWLIGHPLQADLDRALGARVRIANDANCFALSEAVDGAGAGAAVVFGVILGTGVGGGIVADGRVIAGANAVAGEWGHNPLPWPEAADDPPALCYCGRYGCIETYLSGSGLVRGHHGEPNATAEAIARAAARGEPAAAEAVDAYTRRLAKALASVINVLDPDVVVLGGGLSNIQGLYTGVPRLWGQWAFSDRVDTRIARATHGDASGVRGAAWLWEETRAQPLAG